MIGFNNFLNFFLQKKTKHILLLFLKRLCFRFEVHNYLHKHGNNKE